MFKRLANKLLNQAEDVITREAMKAITPHIQTAAEGVMNAVVNSAPNVRSTGGGTSVYLAKVKSDFKDFHAEDADNAIASFIYEMLQITYGMKEDFEKANVSKKKSSLIQVIRKTAKSPILKSTLCPSAIIRNH